MLFLTIPAANTKIEPGIILFAYEYCLEQIINVHLVIYVVHIFKWDMLPGIMVWL